MAELYPVCQLGHPVLRQIAEPIESVHDEWVQQLIDDMIATLTASNGVGLAAPQIGQPYQLLIVASHPNIRYPHAPKMSPTAMVNPKLLNASSEQVKDWEGCLSIPGIRGLVPRHHAVEIEYTDRHGQRQCQTLDGFVARIFQHEFDHLSGLVYLDRLDSVQDIVTEQEYMKRVVA